MSLNPFTARREKKEEKVKELQELRMKELQAYEQEASTQQQLQQFSLPPMQQQEPSDRYATEDFDKYLPASAKSDQSPVFDYNGGASYERPSRARQCFGKLQSGFMIGGALGGAFGFMYGCYAAVVYKHILYLPIAVVQAGGAFGFFLACGTVIRCDEQRRLEYKIPSGPAGAQMLADMSQSCSDLPPVLAVSPTYCAVVSAIVGGSHQ